MSKTKNILKCEKEVRMDKDELIAFLRKGTGMYLTASLLDQLCYEGKIEAGKYAVEICW